MADRVTVERVMAHTRHFFEAGWLEGDFSLTGGRLSMIVQPGQWLCLTGAGEASGVYQADENGLLTGAPDAVFTGRVWFLQPPADFLRLCDEIAAWQEKHGRSACVSQTIGGYARTMGAGRSGAPVGWTEVFAPQLDRWRRMLTEVKL